MPALLNVLCLCPYPQHMWDKDQQLTQFAAPPLGLWLIRALQRPEEFKATRLTAGESLSARAAFLANVEGPGPSLTLLQMLIIFNKTEV